jgi:hypothetical protein
MPPKTAEKRKETPPPKTVTKIFARGDKTTWHIQLVVELIRFKLKLNITECTRAERKVFLEQLSKTHNRECKPSPGNDEKVALGKDLNTIRELYGVLLLEKYETAHLTRDQLKGVLTALRDLVREQESQIHL